MRDSVFVLFAGVLVFRIVGTTVESAIPGATFNEANVGAIAGFLGAPAIVGVVALWTAADTQLGFMAFFVSPIMARVLPVGRSSSAWIS